MSPKISYIIIIGFITLLNSCGSGKNFTSNYYFKNQVVLDSIEASFKNLNKKKPFALQFTDRRFADVSIDIITDSLKYVYVFGLNEVSRMNDTLSKYGLDQKGIHQLLSQMQSIKCTWINTLDYFVNANSRNMIFMSIRQGTWRSPFTPAKYYILTYFSRPQYFDEEGLLLDGRRLKQLRKINGDVFRRINDTVCYTVSKSFR